MSEPTPLQSLEQREAMRDAIAKLETVANYLAKEGITKYATSLIESAAKLRTFVEQS